LFLDEIGDMEPALQVKLLRLLENRTVRRVGGLRDGGVMSDHRGDASSPRGWWPRRAADLYFRIRMIHLSIPALRNAVPTFHCSRITTLRCTLWQAGASLSADARRALLQHRWPGNVRELRNVIEQAVLMSSGPVVESLDLDWLPASAGGRGIPHAS
jgi:transcriptional regulator with PAS, ATPase and Fis domain